MKNSLPKFAYAEGPLLDKTTWPDGPWIYEPDMAYWVDEETGLDCFIARNRLGCLCGYVGVPKGHRLFKQDFECDEVHGGVNFGELSRKGVHTRIPGLTGAQARRLFWFGFDTSRLRDYAPGNFLLRSCPGTTYRDLAYVVSHVQILARAIHNHNA